MESLIKAKKALRGSRPPSKIDLKTLYSLDVDDDIWEDTGLQDDEDSSAEPPDWLSKDSVRDGIKAILAKDRCDEEDTRIIHERCALQEWFSEEWETNKKCLDQTSKSCLRHSPCRLMIGLTFIADDKAMHYQFIRRQNELIELCALWKLAVAGINTGDDEPLAWGPSQEDIMKANIHRNMNNIAMLEDGDISDEVDEDDIDPTYFAALDTVNRADAFRCSTEELDMEASQVSYENPFL